MSAVLEAKDAIRELMATYAMALDACRFADVGACFARDGEWITNYGAARGPDEIAKFIGGIVPVKGEGPQRKHYITNIIITVDGDTRERGVGLSGGARVRERPAAGDGRHLSRQVREDAAGWRFARKELDHHIWGDMALKNGR